MRRLTLIILGLILLLGVALPASAQDNSIADIITGDDRYSTLLEALQVADPSVLETLSGAGSFTLFAPTNQAFQNLADYFETDLDTLLADSALVTDLLLYHVAPDTLTSEELTALNGQLVFTLLEGTAFSVNVEGTTIRLNNISRIESPLNVNASNGVVHTLADMIFPYTLEGPLEALGEGETLEDTPEATVEPSTPTEETEVVPLNTEDLITVTGEEEDVPSAPPSEIVTVASFASDLTLAGRIASDARYSTLTTILESVAPDYLDLLNSPDVELTVIAPTNGAFDNLFYTLGITLEEALEFPVLLRQIVAYHVVEGVYSAEEIEAQDSQRIDTILVNEDFRESFLVLKDGRFITLNTLVRLQSTDLEASNGVIHSARDVLLPQVALNTLTDLGLWSADTGGAG